MKNNITYTILFVILGICLVSVYKYPEIMISPGELIQGHQDLSDNCMACHTLLYGSTSDKCMSCHSIDEIGILTTEGKPIEKDDEYKISFHQGLVQRECIACHSDHLGVSTYRTIRKFTHALLSLEIKSNCNGCHKKPEDKLHGNIKDNCDHCHNDSIWNTTIINHDIYFNLDKDHDVECNTCHTKGNYSHYSCYECHEHSPSSIRNEHIEEGINDYDNCTECHLSADEDDIKQRARTTRNKDRYKRNYKDVGDDHDDEDEEDEDD